MNGQLIFEKLSHLYENGEFLSPSTRERESRKIIWLLQAIIPPGHYPIFHSFMYLSVIPAFLSKKRTVILLLSSPAFEFYSKIIKILSGSVIFIHLSFVLDPLTGRLYMRFYLVKTSKRSTIRFEALMKIWKTCVDEMAENHDDELFGCLNWFCKYIFYNSEKQHDVDRFAAWKYRVLIIQRNGKG